MAEMEWTHPVPAAERRQLPAWAQRLWDKYFDWEDLLTLALLLGATMSVSVTLEAGGWSRQMPALTLVSALAIFAAMLLARSRMPMILAWPASVLAGSAVVFWQTLVMVGPGSVRERLDALYFRFDAWLQAALHDGVANDSLPFNILVLGITWLGVFLFAWSVFRWHNAWIGLVPGGVALFVDLAFVGDSLSGAALLYYLFGFLLIMRTNLISRMAQWRAESVPYPPLVSFTFLNFSFWALLALVIAAWIAPAGPFSTPGFVRNIVIHVEDVGVDFVRLAGPLRSNKLVPVHNYTEVLPFQGSVNLGGRELMTVKVNNEDLLGPFVLRGAVYDTYDSGGWQAGDREAVRLPAGAVTHLNEDLKAGDITGNVVSMSVQMETKTVAGTVLFSVGQPLTSNPSVTAQVPSGSLEKLEVLLPLAGREMSDQEILRNRLPEGYVGVRVVRADDGRVQYVEAFDSRALAAMDSVVLQPPGRIRKGGAYEVTSFVRTATEEELRATERNYPQWVRSTYAQLPADFPPSVAEIARTTVIQYLQNKGTLPTRPSSNGPVPDLNAAAAYDIAKAIEETLRQFPVDYDVKDTPPGRDTVEYFLTEAQRGYFDYHASAMVVMLRALDIPARLGVGYVVDQEDFDKNKNGYVVKDKNTYSWPEVYFPGYGWIVFNPTPDRPADLYPQVGGAGTGAAGEIDLSDFPGLPVSADPLFEFERGPFQVDSVPPETPVGGQGESYTMTILAALAAFAALLAAAVGLGWRRSVAGLPLEQQTWEKLVRLSSLAGHPLQAGQTPAEYANALQRTFRDMRGVSVIAQAYMRSRFGRKAAGPEERQRIRELWPHVRGTLLRAIGRRALRQGRTRPPDFPH